MTVRQLVFFAKPTFEELMSRIKHELDWNDESVGMQGRYDVGGGVMSHKFMLDLNGEIEWQTYIDIVLGSHFKSLEVFAWKKDGRIGKKELIDLNESQLIESPISCHELSERCSRKEELIEEDVEGGEGVNDMADVEVREENDPVREEVHAEENVPLREEVHAEDNVPLREEVNVEENVPSPESSQSRHRVVTAGYLAARPVSTTTPAGSFAGLEVHPRPPVHLALRSQPSHPEGLLGWATAETAKSNLSARWAGAEFPTVSAIMDGAEVPARKPSRRLETAKAHLSARWTGAECPTVSAIMAGAEVPARKPSSRLAGLGLGGCGQVPPSAPGGLALSVPRSAPLWLALRSKPASHPEALLVWALGVAAKSHLSASPVGAEMDRQWMYADRRSKEFIDGVHYFLRVAEANRQRGFICCPCNKCKNQKEYSASRTIHFHLFESGFMPSYNCWTSHGEQGVEMEEDEVEDDNIPDFAQYVGFEGNQTGEEEIAADGNDVADDLGQMLQDAREDCESEKEAHKLDKMLEDHRTSLYPGCEQGHKKLDTTLELLQWKAKNGVSDKAFGDLLKLVKNILPGGNKLPETTYEAKKIVCPLGLEVHKIHACLNDCILYRGEEYENLEACPVCKALRYKIRRDDPGEVDGQLTKKRIPAKVMWYFPIIPRLRRLFRNKGNARMLRWHAEERQQDGILRHPADGSQWRNIDRKFKEFGKDARNIRFGLSTDGMNPFGEMSSGHSTWPVTMCIYNLPPWLCMKRKYIMMPIIIQGPKQPGNDIDVYLRPLVEDLKQLWKKEGVPVWDKDKQEEFNLRALLFVTINDWPALSNLSGQSNKGYKACTHCMDETESTYLKHCRKVVYMGHRRFLAANHPVRKKGKHFEHKADHRTKPKHRSGKTVFAMVKDLKVVFGKGPGSQHIESEDGHAAMWKKNSIFWELPYWEFLDVRHAIDVMHLTKNLCVNLLGFLGVYGKSKDTLEARNDLKHMEQRGDLHPEPKEKGSHYLSPASYTLSKAEKESMFECLESIKMADRDEEQILYDTIAEGSSQYWNEEEGNEDPNQYLNEEGNVERDAEGNQQGHVERDVEGNQEEEASGSQPSVGQKRARGQRGAAKKLEGRHIITEVEEDGRPSAPAEAAKNYVRHSGWVVRDNVPVSTVYWRRTRARGDHESFVPDSEKEMLWTTMLETFTLPAGTEDKVKRWTLKKMAEQFQSFKGDLYQKYILKGQTPNFDTFPKLRDHWDEFVAYKIGEQGKAMMERNKENAAKKKYHHHLGSGGYSVAMPKWEQMEASLIERGIEPATANWPERSKFWYYAHGGTLNPADGSLVFGYQIQEAARRLTDAVEASSQGTFRPDRDRDELTLALQTPEHPGRTRGKGVIPWKIGFKEDIHTYRSRMRSKRDTEAKIADLEFRVRATNSTCKRRWQGRLMNAWPHIGPMIPSRPFLLQW
uniref:Transposon protein, putative, CACTA, En/Spm sub-class n=1 Tax=Oryza sativa subsp. japonica TaxID=39947 RepID=Q2RAX4_ORYSJ|nr:transposon protein, putative, CACTA, En/Spm sub-class [Oryza sativa Japonica Group]